MARSFVQAQDEMRVAREQFNALADSVGGSDGSNQCYRGCHQNNEQKIRRHDVNEGVGFGFVIIEYWSSYRPPRRGFLIWFANDRRKRRF